MQSRSWTLMDVDKQIWVDELSVGDHALGLHKRRMRGGASDGVDVIDVYCDPLQLTIVPTRGMGIWRAQAGGTRFGWESPVRGPVHPALVPLGQADGLGWLAGFDELLVRCGLDNNGAPQFDANGTLEFPLHGRIANCPAHRVTVQLDEAAKSVTVIGVVEETRFHFQKYRLTVHYRCQSGRSFLEIVDRVENFGGCPAAIQLLYHFNFGPPLLGPDAVLRAPLQRLVPRNQHDAREIDNWDCYPAPSAGEAEQVYFAQLLADTEEQTHVMLDNARAGIAAALSYPVTQLPFFSLWKNGAAAADGYVTGLEPATNFPNPRRFERQHGRMVDLAPGSAAEFSLRMHLFNEPAAIETMRTRIAQLSTQAVPDICRQPDPQWCQSG